MADDRIKVLADRYRRHHEDEERSQAIEVSDELVRELIFAEQFDPLWNTFSEALRRNAIAFNDEAGLGQVFTAEVYPHVARVTRRDGAALRVACDHWDVSATIESANTTQALPISVDIISDDQLAFALPIQGVRSAPQNASDAAYSLFARLVEIE